MIAIANNSLNLGCPINRSAALNRGLLGWWKVLPDGRRGSTFTNLDPRYGNAAFAGGLGSGAVGALSHPGGFGSIKFANTSGNRAEIAYNPVFDFAGPFSLAVWLKTVGLGTDQGILEHVDSGGSVNKAWLLYFESGYINYKHYVSGSGSVLNVNRAGTGVANGDWTHYLTTFDGTNRKIYENGLSIASDTAGQPDAKVDGKVYIGTLGSSVYPFNGWIDDVRIYERALSASEAVMLFNASRAGYRSELNRLSRPLVNGTAAAAVSGRFFGAGNYMVGA